MNKKVLFAATVAAVLASCSSDDLSVQTAAKQETQGLENAVSFEAYSQRSLTRAGYAGAMDNDKLKTEGFGVFGYYTDLNEYDQTSTPNFMYNQEVKYSGGSWTYEPIKYWPNEYGNKAQSDDVDKLTFFAYAPYTANTPATGKVTADQVGITGFTRNTAAGDPYVKYVGSLDPTKCVDLCWGVVDPSADQTWDIINGGSQTMAKGMPWMNVQRPQKSLGQKMKFVFKHALSQLNVQIDADVNTNKHGEGVEVDSKSKVYVRSITFNGFAMKGALNLNNEEANTPNWKGYNCSNEPLQSEEYTIYDGMKDGKEGTGYTASNEKVTGLNPSIIQTKGWDAVGTEEGVTKTAKNLFKGAVNDPIYVIPTGDDMSVTIVYDIETKDDNLAGTVSDLETAGVSVENKITKTITVTGSDPSQALKLEAGKKYTIQLHLGLSQVEFDAAVEEWSNDAVNGEAWLPGNGEAIVAPTSVSISGADALAANNYAGQLTATVTPDNATDKTVTWSSSNPDLLKVDANGNVTLAGGIPLAGADVTITATSNADGNVKDTKTITVKPALGMFIASDGKAYTTKTADAKAYIAYLSANTDESLAIALENSISGTNWADASSATTPKWMNDAKPAAIDGGTWRWPSKTDFENMLPQLQTLPPNGGGIIRSVRYWSTTEYERNTSTAYDLSFSGSGSDVFIGSKVDYYRDVRAVFAF